MKIFLKYLFISGLSAILIMGCNRKKNEYIYSETFKELHGSLFIDEDHLKDPFTITTIDSFLIVGNLKGIPVIEIYDRFSGELLCTFLRIGQGPLEVLALSQVQNINDDKKMIISDLFSRKMLMADKSKIGKDTVIIEPFFNFIDYDQDIIAKIGKIAYLNDTYNIVTTIDNNGRIGLLNKEEKSLSYFYPFTDSEVLFPELDSYRNNNLFSSDMTICKENNRIAFSTHMADMLYIYEYSDDKLIPVWHHKTFLPNGIKLLTFENTPPQAFFTDKSLVGYLDITSSAKNVYALFVGISNEEGDTSYTNRIRVFNWEGENRFEIRTNYPLKRIAVDKDDQFLYGISKKDEVIIIRFSLKDLK